MIRWIAFDADDTLWENEKYYYAGQVKLADLLSYYLTYDEVQAELLRTETDNMPLYGYGIKAFGLSMIETAIRVSNGAVGSREVSVILDHLRSMLEQQTEVFSGVVEVLEALKPDYQLMVITKGDILDQERKLLKSGLEKYFFAYEVVSDKKHDTYKQILNRHNITPNQFLMVGNSLRSDVLPVVKLGGYGVYIPHSFTWEHEVISDVTPHDDGFIQISAMSELLEVVQILNNHN